MWFIYSICEPKDLWWNEEFAPSISRDPFKVQSTVLQRGKRCMTVCTPHSFFIRPPRGSWVIKCGRVRLRSCHRSPWKKATDLSALQGASREESEVKGVGGGSGGAQPGGRSQILTSGLDAGITVIRMPRGRSGPAVPQCWCPLAGSPRRCSAEEQSPADNRASGWRRIPTRRNVRLLETAGLPDSSQRS